MNRAWRDQLDLKPRPVNIMKTLFEDGYQVVLRTGAGWRISGTQTLIMFHSILAYPDFRFSRSTLQTTGWEWFWLKPRTDTQYVGVENRGHIPGDVPIDWQRLQWTNPWIPRMIWNSNRQTPVLVEDIQIEGGQQGNGDRPAISKPTATLSLVTLAPPHLYVYSLRLEVVDSWIEKPERNSPAILKEVAPLTIMWLPLHPTLIDPSSLQRYPAGLF